jgi:hypothetical protein
MMVLDSTLDVAHHRTRTSRQNESQNVEETITWVHEPVPANLILAHPPGGHYIALCTLEAAVADVLCK